MSVRETKILSKIGSGNIFILFVPYDFVILRKLKKASKILLNTVLYITDVTFNKLSLHPTEVHFYRYIQILRLEARY